MLNTAKTALHGKHLDWGVSFLHQLENLVSDNKAIAEVATLLLLSGCYSDAAVAVLQLNLQLDFGHRGLPLCFLLT